MCLVTCFIFLRSDAATTVKLIHDKLSNLTADIRLTIAGIGHMVEYLRLA